MEDRNGVNVNSSETEEDEVVNAGNVDSKDEVKDEVEDEEDMGRKGVAAYELYKQSGRQRKGRRSGWPLKSKRPRLTCSFACELAKGLCVLWLVLLILSWNLGNLGLYQFATPHIY